MGKHRHHLSKSHRNPKGGFTVVELLVVIVVVGILAVISIVAFNGVHQKARDAQRMVDIKSIEKALRMYKSRNGGLPASNGPSSGAWETSLQNSPQGFIRELSLSGILNPVPVDPINSGGRYYRYYLYPAGTSGCDASKGRIAIVQAIDMESSGRPHPSNPGFSCPSRNWSTEADYTIGVFEY